MKSGSLTIKLLSLLTGSLELHGRQAAQGGVDTPGLLHVRNEPTNFTIGHREVRILVQVHLLVDGAGDTVRIRVCVGWPRAVILMSPDGLRVREGAVWALSRTDEAQVVEPLVAALSDSKEEVRQAAAKALESARYDLKRTALNLLGESDSLEAIELLITHLIEKPNKVRTIAEC